MALEIILRDTSQDIVVVGERLWLTADRERVVKDGDPEAAFLLCGDGGQITRSDAERYGLIDGPGNPTATAVGDEADLTTLNMATLRELAAAREVDIKGLKKKAQLIAAIEAATPPAPPAEDQPPANGNGDEEQTPA
jgi:hypothetical protein